MTVPRTLRATIRSKPIAHAAGGEQAANTLQPAGSNRHAATPNAKVRGAIDALPLTTRWWMFPFTRQRSQGSQEALREIEAATAAFPTTACRAQGSAVSCRGVVDRLGPCDLAVEVVRLVPQSSAGPLGGSTGVGERPIIEIRMDRNDPCSLGG